MPDCGSGIADGVGSLVGGVKAVCSLRLDCASFASSWGGAGGGGGGGRWWEVVERGEIGADEIWKGKGEANEVIDWISY